MKYSMEAEVEASRLEEQVFQRNYSIAEELGRFHFDPNERVLDAGCGTGVLARYLVNTFSLKEVDAIDYSDLRLKQAANLSTGAAKSAISFYQQDLENIDSRFYGKYDTVICRYVVEHCKDPIRVLGELRKTLKTGGRLILFELDGVFVNLYSENQKFNDYMDEVKKGFHFDLHIGKKLPNYLKRVEFSAVEWEAELLSCKGERLQEEMYNTEKRFSALTPFLTDLLGSRERFEEFTRLYLEEMASPENTLVFTKYICSGRKI